MSKQTREEKNKARQEKLQKIADSGKDVQKIGFNLMAIGCMGIILIGIVVLALAFIL